MDSEAFNTSDKQFRENINFIKDLFYPSLTSNSSASQLDLMTNWPLQNTANEMRSPPSNSALQALAMLANRESGMTPTPTNENPSSYRSPKLDITTPKTALMPRGSQQHSTPASGSITNQQLSPGDSSGISTGTDASDGSFHSSGSHRACWPPSFSSLPNPSSPNQPGSQSKPKQSSSSSITNSMDPLILSALSGANDRSISESMSSMPRYSDSTSSIGSHQQSPTFPAGLSASTQQLADTIASMSRFPDVGSLTGAQPQSPTFPTGLGSSVTNQQQQQQLSDSLTEQQMNEMLMAMLYNSYLGGTTDTTAAQLTAQLSVDDQRQLFQQELILRYLNNPLATGGIGNLASMLPNLNNYLTTPDLLMNSFTSAGSGLAFSSTSPANNSAALGLAAAAAMDTSNSSNATTSCGLAAGSNPANASTLSPDFMENVNAMTGLYRRMIGPMMGEIEKAACQYRNSANSVSQKFEVPYNWTGNLPARIYKNASFSKKVFLGGVPWDSTSEDLVAAFNCFGTVSVMWPQKEGALASHNPTKPKGYCYLIFENENSVRLLLNSCARDSNGGDYFKIASPKFRSKDVQVIPWVVNDSQFNKSGSHRPDMKRTVFIGALHGMITAEALTIIMDDLFDNVTFCALDTDKFKYPIGSGRVAFSSQKSYVRAVTANFVDVRTTKFAKTIQIDPYLEDSMCNNCFVHAGVYFCRAFECFRYFCPACWHVWHNRAESLYNHKPLRRTFKAAAAQNH